MGINKKGQSVLDNFGSLAIGVGTLAIILVVAFLIMAQGKTTGISLITPTTYDYATISIPNASTTTFANCIIDEDMTIIGTYNGSDNNEARLLAPGNYTISKNTVYMDTKITPQTSNKNASYSCKGTDTAYNSTRTLQNATSTVPSWVSIIIITSIGAALIGMVMMFRR